MPDYLAAMVRRYDRSLGATRLERVMRGLAEPWSVPGIARELRDGLSAAVDPEAQDSLSALLARAASWIDVEPRDAEREPALAGMDEIWAEIEPVDGSPGPVNEELLARLSELMAAAHDALGGLAAGMDDGERALLRRRFPEWCEAWHRSHFPGGELTQAQSLLIDEYEALHRKIDRPLLLAVGARLARLCDPGFLASLGRRLAKTGRARPKVEGFPTDVVATAGESEESRVVLLGSGKTVVSGRAALVIDLAGNDTWRRAAVVDGDSTLACVVLDLGGDDLWDSDGPGPAYAAGGIALLADAKGKDRYVSARLGQGASAHGLAALCDLAGDDLYSAQDFVQGCTFAGVALLLDLQGDDRYEAWAYAQGAGYGNGFSACVDGEGKDSYRANGHWPDVYGDSGPDSFHGASQGYCTGSRDGSVQLAGGIAALADFGDGEDEYESGNFSQGGGYFFSLGLMYDGGGDDVNRGYRYSQGFGVHQAVGIRWDRGGDDAYETKCAANCGAGWDEGVGWLIDEEGDDAYSVGGLALGGTANSAVAVLLDLAGDDLYGGGGGSDSQGGSGDSSYHDFQAIGALIDLGGGKDSYARAGRADGSILTGEWYGLFVDVRDERCEDLLDSAKLAARIRASGAR